MNLARGLALFASAVLATSLTTVLTEVPAQAAVGPPLVTPVTVLDAALQCGPGLDSAPGTPVLLVHGTSSTPEESWGFGYAKVLPTLGHPVCTVRLPDRAWNDIQTSTEYVVYAVREMVRRSGRRISVLGHSEGTVQPLWALRFWPDMADSIDDYLALAPPLQGTAAVPVVCAILNGCPAAVWQYSASSNFIAAMNRSPFPTGPSYTAVATLLDELVVPQPAASRHSGVTTVVVQHICPGRIVEHAGLLADAVGFAVVMDALDHPGPADPARISHTVCGRVLFPGVNPAEYAVAAAVFVTNFAATALTATYLKGEPALRDYAKAG